jgi:hypothetical protein
VKGHRPPDEQCRAARISTELRGDRGRQHGLAGSYRSAQVEIAVAPGELGRPLQRQTVAINLADIPEPNFAKVNWKTVNSERPTRRTWSETLDTF